MVFRKSSDGPGWMNGVGGLERRKIQAEGMAFVKSIPLFTSVFPFFLFHNKTRTKI